MVPAYGMLFLPQNPSIGNGWNPGFRFILSVVGAPRWVHVTDQLCVEHGQVRGRVHVPHSECTAHAPGVAYTFTLA